MSVSMSATDACDDRDAKDTEDSIRNVGRIALPFAECQLCGTQCALSNRAQLSTQWSSVWNPLTHPKMIC